MPAGQIESFREVDPQLGWIEVFTGYRNQVGDIVKHGEYRRLTASGILLEQGNLVDGFRHGTWREFHENGRPSSVGNYDHGQAHGHYQSWYEDENPQIERMFVDNYAHGLQRIYHRNGVLREECHLDFDLKQGECRTWDELGALLAVGEYRNDMPWEGTFVVVPPMEPDDCFPTFNEYMDRFVHRGLVVAEFRAGEFQRIIDDRRTPLPDRTRAAAQDIGTPDEALREGIDALGAIAPADPEAVWEFVAIVSEHPDEEVQQLAATRLLGPILEYHFAAFVTRIEERVTADATFARLFLRCPKIGQANEPANAASFDRLHDLALQTCGSS